MSSVSPRWEGFVPSFEGCVSSRFPPLQGCCVPLPRASPLVPGRVHPARLSPGWTGLPPPVLGGAPRTALGATRMTLGALGMTLGAPRTALVAVAGEKDAAGCAGGQQGCCLPSAGAGCCQGCQAGAGDWPRALGGCKALHRLSALPLCSLGLVLPPYSTYYIQANLSDQILQVKCK